MIAFGVNEGIAEVHWIDRSQLGRRNLNPDTASLLRGRIYNRTKKAEGRPAGKQLDQNDPVSTSAKLATQFGVGEATIKRDGQFARAVEDVKKADPTIEQRVHSGEVSKQSVVATVHASHWWPLVQDHLAISFSNSSQLNECVSYSFHCVCIWFSLTVRFLVLLNSCVVAEQQPGPCLFEWIGFSFTFHRLTSWCGAVVGSLFVAKRR